MCNQHTIVLYEIPLILWILFLLKEYLYKTPASIIYLSISYVTGLTPYLYLPLSEYFHPSAGSWGHVTTFSGLLHHILRRDYGTFQLYSGEVHDRLNTSNTNHAQSIFLFSFSSLESVIKNIHLRTQLYVHDFVYDQTAGWSTGCFVFVSIGIISCVMIPLLYTILSSTYASTHSKSNSRLENTTTTTSKSHVNNNNNNHQKIMTQNKQLIEEMSSKVIIISDILVSYTPFIIFITFLFYVFVFHGLSNLPIAGPSSNQLFYGIHARFWMQPNIILFYFAGIGLMNSVILIDELFIHRAAHFIQLYRSREANNNNSFDRIDDGSHSSDSQNKNTEKTNNNKNSNKKRNDNNTSSTTNKKVDNHNTNTKTSIHANNNNSSSSSSSSSTGILEIVVIILSIIIIYYYQYQRNLDTSNQSEADYFHRYAHAMLAPLPEHAVLLVNADQKWSSLRYLQQCEHVRKDVVLINLSMMTYSAWFRHKQTLYSQNHSTVTNNENNNMNNITNNTTTSQSSILFPTGDYLATSTSAAVFKKQAYSLIQFLDMNIPVHKVFFTGSLQQLNYPDPAIIQKYETLNVGLTIQFIPRTEIPLGRPYMKQTDRRLRQVLHELPLRQLPSEDKYTEATWEWTVRRDIYDRFTGITICYVFVVLCYL